MSHPPLHVIFIFIGILNPLYVLLEISLLDLHFTISHDRTTAPIIVTSKLVYDICNQLAGEPIQCPHIMYLARS